VAEQLELSCYYFYEKHGITVESKPLLLALLQPLFDGQLVSFYFISLLLKVFVGFD